MGNWTVDKYLSDIKGILHELGGSILQPFKDFIDRVFTIFHDESVTNQTTRALVIGAIAWYIPAVFITWCKNFLIIFVGKVLTTACTGDNKVWNHFFIAMFEIITKCFTSSASGNAETVSLTEKVFFSAFVVNVLYFAVSTSISYHKYENGDITREQHKKHVYKRAMAAVGSTVGATIGAFFGSIICSHEFGSIVGSVIGGMFGDFLGSKLEKLLMKTKDREEKEEKEEKKRKKRKKRREEEKEEKE